jgi:hypothetical protein
LTFPTTPDIIRLSTTQRRIKGMLCRECNEKLKDKGVLRNDEMCTDCREMVEKIVESETKELVAWT